MTKPAKHFLRNDANSSWETSILKSTLENPCTPKIEAKSLADIVRLQHRMKRTSFLHNTNALIILRTSGKNDPENKICRARWKSGHRTSLNVVAEA